MKKKWMMVLVGLCLMTIGAFGQEEEIDWAKYIENFVFNMEISNPQKIRDFFEYYESVKDNPFEVGTMAEDIKEKFANTGQYEPYDEYGNFNNISMNQPVDGEMKRNYVEVANILCEYRKYIDFSGAVYAGLQHFIKDEVNELEMFTSIASIIKVDGWAGIKENAIVPIKLKNPHVSPENALVIKYKGKAVDGVLGKRAEFAYSIDYNGKKDVNMQYINLKVDFNGRLHRGSEQKHTAIDFPALLIGDSYFFIDSDSISLAYPALEGYKIRSFDKHEDGITKVQKGETGKFLNVYYGREVRVRR